MTLIAHSYLSAKKAILNIADDAVFCKYAEQANMDFCLVNKETELPVLPENPDEKLIKLRDRMAKIKRKKTKAKNQLRKLGYFEEKLIDVSLCWYPDIYSIAYKIKWLRPFSAEIAILSVPIVTLYATCVLSGEGIKSLKDYASKRKAEKIAKQEEKQEQERLAKEQKIEEERLAEQKKIADEGATKEAPDLEKVCDIIAKSQSIENRSISDKTDKSAIIMGMALPSIVKHALNEKIKLSENVYAFYYRRGFEEIPYDNHMGDEKHPHAEMNVFYVNPETGNYHQIARFVAKNSIYAIFDKIRTRKTELAHMNDYKQSLNKVLDHTR